MNGAAEFQDFIAARGFQPPERMELGRWIRFATSDKRGDDAGSAKLFPDCEGGIVYDHRTGEHFTWQAARRDDYTEAERRAFRERIERERLEAARIEAEERAKAAERARTIWNNAKPAPSEHPYLTAKGIQPHGARLYSGPLAINGMRCHGALVLPVYGADKALQSLEFIAPDGGKRFLPGGAKSGGYFPIGKPSGRMLIAEGFATGAAVHEATGCAVAVAFDAGNLERVAGAMRQRFPEAEIIIAADDDAETICKRHKAEGATRALDPREPRPEWCRCNPGLTKALEAARSIGGKVAAPAVDRAADFNDMAQTEGPAAVKAAIEGAAAPAALAELATLATVADSEGWPELQPLTESHEAQPYPIDALPGDIGRAVSEVIDFVRAPTALAANAALSVLALAVQGLVNVRRAEGLDSPASLYFMAIAESGERKSTCDNYFTKPLRQWETDKIEALRVETARAVADLRAWQAECEGIEAAIKAASSKGDTQKVGALRRDLEEAQAAEPPAPKVPQLVYEEATPEALLHTLSIKWPSGAVISSEAGIVFGGHGMKGDSIMRNLAVLNKAWDGTPIRISRRTSESFTTDGVRLSMGLAVQPDTVRAFFSGSGGLARGTGFAARFLFAWPESTQGTRTFREAGGDWPGVNAYHRRIRELLDAMEVPERGPLALQTLTLSPGAAEVWRTFHDDVERELRANGEMRNLRDVASKAADNAARLAALFHVFQEGHKAGQVSAGHMEAGCKLAGWHLYEARRFLGELSTPSHLSNASKLEGWLIRECQDTGSSHVARARALQHGPNPTRTAKALDEALRELEQRGRIRQATEGRKALILVRPELVQGA
jgi:putative DNA primase/helicase